MVIFALPTSQLLFTIMDTNIPLKIVKTKRISLVSKFYVICIYITIINAPVLLMNEFINKNYIHHGEETLQLIHQVKSVYGEPRPFASSWIEPNVKIPPFHYDHIWDAQLFFGLLLVCYPWRKHWEITANLIKLFIPNVKKHELFVYVMFFIFCLCFSFIVLFSMDGIVTFCYWYTKNNMIEWLDHSVIDATPNLQLFYIKNKAYLHPFTMGLSAPFKLERHYRYLQEDVEFHCEYVVESLESADPVYQSSWWKKNGEPVIADHRIFVNISIRAEEQIHSQTWFLIRSTLTILLVREEDFGSYSCDYYNPMKVRVSPRAHKKCKTQDTFKEIKQENVIFDPETQLPPMSPRPDCGCKPNTMKDPEFSKIVITYDQTCFSEFELIRTPSADKIIPVKVSPGGILFEVASYWTVADKDDILVDITSEESSSVRESPECCSIFIKLYWIFFKGGGFYDMPFSRLLNDENKIITGNWRCVCQSSYGLQNQTFLREYYNTSNNASELIEIDFPLKLSLEPINKHTVPFADSLPFCTTDVNETLTLCNILDNALTNPVFTVYTYDAIFFTGIFFISCIIFIIVNSIRRFITIPMKRFCRHMFTDVPGQFFTAKGQPIMILGTAKSDQTCKTKTSKVTTYDIYLSFSEEDEFAIKVCRYLRALFTNRGLKVFDASYDVLPGRVTLNVISKAIENSRRFVILASQAYLDDRQAKMEFSCIRDMLVHQNTSPKLRQLVILLEDCDIRCLHRVACIRVPQYMKEYTQLDEDSVMRIKEWELLTRPVVAVDTSFQKLVTKLRFCGFSWRSGISCTFLVLLAIRSSFFISYDTNLSYFEELLETLGIPKYVVH